MRTLKLILLITFVLLMIPLLYHHYLNKFGSSVDNNDKTFDLGEPIDEFSPVILELVDVDKLKGIELKIRIEELMRIKNSVSLELRGLEAKRQKLQTEIGQLNKRLEESKNEASRRKNELDRLQISLLQAKVAEKEAIEKNTPRLGRPKPLNPMRKIPIYPIANTLQNNEVIDHQHNTYYKNFCQMDTCFDYSLCPFSSKFSFYLYPFYLAWSNSKDTWIYVENQNIFSVNNTNNNNGKNEGSGKAQQLHEVLFKNSYQSSVPRKACLFIIIVNTCESSDEATRDEKESINKMNKLSKSLKNLPNFNGDGRNHIIWLNCNTKSDFQMTEEIHNNVNDNKYIRNNSSINSINEGRAIIVSESANLITFRKNFDLVISHWDKTIATGQVWSQLPSIVPAKRKYIATYLGGSTIEVQAELLKIQQQDPSSFVFQFSCITSSSSSSNSQKKNSILNNSEIKNQKESSNLCENEMLRTRLLLDSTFSLLIMPSEGQETDFYLSTRELQLRLYESLKYGSIPVILGTRFEPPFEETIDWDKVIIRLPSAKITEMHYLLKSLNDADLLQMKKNGRHIFERYLSTTENVVNTLLATLRTRIGIPSSPYQDTFYKSAFANDSLQPLKLDSSFSLDPEDDAGDESLGPIEPPYPSATFFRNYTSTFLQKYDLWNIYYQPFKLFPHLPWDLIQMPSEAKFRGSSVGFRPIAAGAGGSGKEFSESLGGNIPKEQFTVVMLTYEREQVLMKSLQRLFALPYLNKVVVVWNSPNPPSPELKWPDIGTPIQVVKGEKNSLNNRFIPFDIIETEAILSIDDDAHLRHDEIVFGFRVWRENRDRIVGFPGRFHAWDLNNGGWLYNSNYSCELSMVLTGAAFYHKVYSYLYTNEMPKAIRDKVDDLMNCEDIAMNFLVSHVTQKPPVKVTSRWTFRCPGCPVTLSEDDSHFQERHHCINFFSKVYGYTPLLYTEFRADSILFKTRIPHDKQKCFKYI